jgi:hypothetical protein
VVDVRAPLSVDADVEVTLEEGTARVRGYGDLVVVELSTLAAARELATGASTLASSASALPIDGLAGPGELGTGGVTVDVRVRGLSVARAGPGITPGPLSRLLGAAPASVSLGGVVLAGIRDALPSGLTRSP